MKVYEILDLGIKLALYGYLSEICKNVFQSNYSHVTLKRFDNSVN